MNIFERIFRRKTNSIDLEPKKLRVFKRIVAEKSVELTMGKDMFQNTENFITAKDESVLWYWKNINPWLTNLFFTWLMKLFFWIKMFKNQEWTNALNVMDDFDSYLFNTDFLKKKVKFSETFIFVWIFWMISVLIWFIYFIIYDIDMKSVLPEWNNGFDPLESLYNSKVAIISVWVIVFALMYFIMNKILKNKILYFQKITDAYLMNMLIYHYIFNSYNSEKLHLWYFYFKGIIENIINKLRDDKKISDNEYMLYIIFLWEPKNNSEFVSNKEIGNILRLYYAYSRVWTNKWYDTVRTDITKTYITNKKNYEHQLAEWRKSVENIAKIIWFISLFSILFTLYGIIFKVIAIVNSWTSM